MNKEWSELCKKANTLLKKKVTFEEGKLTLLELRKNLFDTVMMVYGEFPKEGYYQRPCPNSKGYDSKTIAYQIFHISRIEDIVVHTLIKQDEEIFIEKDYQKKMNSSIKTTGNEILGSGLETFSKRLNIEELMNYFKDVYETDNNFIKELSFESLKKSFDDEDKERIRLKEVVSQDEEANWLIDYWCGKDVLGLLGMPLSRHWIMHIEALLKIKNKLVTKEKKSKI